MRVAICNSNEKALKKLKKAIYLYAENKRIELMVENFKKTEEIPYSNTNYELIFLCCQKSDFEACKIAKKIREVNSKCAIVFLSPDTSLVLEAFKVNAFRFLVEPVTESDLFCVLEDFFESKGNDYYLWFKSHADTFCVNTKEIVFIEAENKNCFINLPDNSIKYNQTMAKVFEKLPKSHFFKISRSCVINGDYIDKYSSQYVYLKTGEQIKVTRNFLPDFIEDYQCYKTPVRLI